MSQHSASAQIEQNSSSLEVAVNSSNFIEVQEMHVQKSKHSQVILPPKTQNFVSPTDRNLSPCTRLLQAKKAKTYKNCKPVLLNTILVKALKDQETQTEAEDTNVELFEDD